MRKRPINQHRSFHKVLNRTVLTADNVLMIKSGGSWAWRNINPGNLRKGMAESGRFGEMALLCTMRISARFEVEPSCFNYTNIV